MTMTFYSLDPHPSKNAPTAIELSRQTSFWMNLVEVSSENGTDYLLKENSHLGALLYIGQWG